MIVPIDQVWRACCNSYSPSPLGISRSRSDEDRACLDMAIQALLTSRTTFYQERKDDANMTILHATIRYKNKMRLFLCILFSYFESGFLPKDIIISLGRNNPISK